MPTIITARAIKCRCTNDEEKLLRPGRRSFSAAGATPVPSPPVRRRGPLCLSPVLLVSTSVRHRLGSHNQPKKKRKHASLFYFFCLSVDPPSPVPRETLEGHPLPASPRRYSLHKRKPQFSDFIYIFTSRYPTTNQPQYSTIRFLPPPGLEKQWRLTRNLANRLGKQNRRGSKNPRLQCSAAVPIYRTKSVLSPPQLCSCP